MSNQPDIARIQTPPSEEDSGFDDYTIAMLPTPQEHRFCHHGQLSAHWDVNEGNVHVTVPDLTVGAEYAICDSFRRLLFRSE